MEPSEPGGRKYCWPLTLMILTLFISNIFIYLQVNKIASRDGLRYIPANVNLSGLSGALEHVQKGHGRLCVRKGSDSLRKAITKPAARYQGLLERLNDKTIDKPGKKSWKEHPHDVGILSGYDPGCGAGQAGAERGASTGEAYGGGHLPSISTSNTAYIRLNELQFKTTLPATRP